MREQYKELERIMAGIYCPVDITVYDESNNIIGRIINNIVDESVTSIMVAVVGDMKYIILPVDSSVTLRLNATDIGTMDYIISKFNVVTGDILSDSTFNNVTLTTGKLFSSGINTSQSIENVRLFVVDGNDTAIAEVLENGTELPIITTPTNCDTCGRLFSRCVCAPPVDTTTTLPSTSQPPVINTTEPPTTTTAPTATEPPTTTTPTETTPPNNDTLLDRLIREALKSDNPYIVATEETGSVISENALWMIRASGKTIRIKLVSGLVITIDSTTITDNARSIDLDVEIIATKEGNPSANIPNNSVFMFPRGHGEFGFEMSFVVSAEQISEAGLVVNKARLFHVDSINRVTEKGKFTINSDYSFTITIDSNRQS
jgi:hypothetical protein